MKRSKYSSFNELPLMLTVQDVADVLGIGLAHAYEVAHRQVDRKLRRKIQEKKIAMGHKPDDHEEQQPEMTMQAAQKMGRKTRNKIPSAGRVERNLMKRSKYSSFNELPLMLTVQDVADVLGIGLAHAYEVAHRQDFPTITLGSRIIVPRDKFMAWIDEQAAKKTEIF